MSFYDDVMILTKQRNRRNEEMFFKGTILATKLKIAAAAEEGKTETSVYGDYECADPKKIGEYFKLQGFKYRIEDAVVGWKIIFNWE